MTKEIEEDIEITTLIELAGEANIVLDYEALIQKTLELNSALDLEGY